ncbi:MAG: hypothetical protein P9M06_04775 [Candidatus Saelkia tenebricola]|nr:hypothetical protein [Candidatus Saelkia tenebricola]
MIDRLYKFTMFIFTVSVIISFFLPWISVNTQPVGKVTTALITKDDASFTKISGFRIPILASSEDVRLIVSIARIFNPSIQDVEKKVWFLWFVPVLAWFIFLLSGRFYKSRFINLAYTIIGCGIFLISFYEIQTADLENIILKIKIESGFWFTIWAYLGIGILGLLRFETLSSKKRKW